MVDTEALTEWGEPVLVSYRIAYTLVVRVAGVAADKHTMILLESKYDRVHKDLVLAHSSIVLALQLPAGNLAQLHARTVSIADAVHKLTPDIPLEVALDITRSPLAYEGFPKDPMPFVLTTSGLDRYAAPYRYIGRMLLLSQFQVLLRDRKLIVALQPDDSPVTVSRSVLERALSTVQVKLPKSETEESFLSDTGPDDDLALTVGLAVLLSNEKLLTAEDLRFAKEREKYSHSWVV